MKLKPSVFGKRGLTLSRFFRKTDPKEQVWAYLHCELSRKACNRFEAAVDTDPNLKAKLEQSRKFDRLLREFLQERDA